MGSLFITGSSGFIGRNLVQKIADTKYDHIYCLMKNETSIRQGVCQKKNCSLIYGNITEPASYAPYLASVDTVVHLAAATGKASPQEYFATNTMGTDILVEQSRKSGIKHFLYISSIAVKFPKTTGYYYAQSKERAEQIVKWSGLNYIILRPTIVLGKGAPIWESLSRLARLPVIPIFGSGITPIQPIYIQDFVDCVLYILDDDLFPNETVELGGPEEITIENFLKTIHLLYFRREPPVIRIPLKPLIWFLSLVEKSFYTVLPVTAGQLAAFANDGTIETNKIFLQRASSMRNVGEMLTLLTGIRR